MFKIPENENFKRIKFNNLRMCDDDGYDLVLWLRNDDRGELFHKAIVIKKAFGDYFDIGKVISSYTYRDKYDLSGFEDSIENPKGAEVIPAAIISEGELEGSIFGCYSSGFMTLIGSIVLVNQQKKSVLVYP